MNSKTQSNFEELVQLALKHAAKQGASSAAAEISESSGLAVSVRKGSVETVEQTNDRSLGVTVFAGQSRGSASTSDLSAKAIAETVEAAWNIAKYTAADPAAGLPEPELLATHLPDLKLHKSWDISADQAVKLAVEAEQGALGYSKEITNSEGASIDISEGRFVFANSLGFMSGYPYSRHGLSVAAIAGKGDRMQRDYWYTSDRYPERLAKGYDVGVYAAQRALSRLSARKIPTGKYPVLFEAPLALGLVGALTQAISGGALYRKSSFLLDSLGQQVMADHIHIHEDPFIPGAMGSSTFDDEGVQTRARDLVQAGVLQGYLLSCYTARKLGLQTTGNAGGSHNLQLTSTLTQAGDNLEAMLKKMGTGLLVTELIGQGVNYVTGDYSRGAFGYWVENGQIQHAVQEITIAGNLKDMFMQMVAVGNDAITRGAKTSGSILIESMAVAGS